MRFLRAPWKPPRKKTEEEVYEPSGSPVEPKAARFKVTVKPKLRDGEMEWWAKVDEHGNQIAHHAGYSKEYAERQARSTIRNIKEKEEHESQAGAEFEVD